MTGARLYRFRPTLVPPLIRSDDPHAVPDALTPERVALMPFIVDDKFHSHAKVVALSLAARGLWTTAGAWSSDHRRGGFTPDHVLASFGSTPELVAELCAAGLWERARRGIRFHDWEAWNDTAETAIAKDAHVQRKRAFDARRQALFRNPELKQAIRDRDDDRCRYCGIQVRWGKGKACDSGTYDHVDPEGLNSLANLVVACLSCNSAKKRRTPAEAGMILLDPPTPRNASRNGNGSPASGAEDAKPQAAVSAMPFARDSAKASRNGSRNGSGNASDGKAAAQKRYGKRDASVSPSVAPPSDDLDFDQSIVGGQSVNQVEDRNARAREKPPEPDPEPFTPEFRLLAQGEMAAAGHDDVTDAEADGLTAEVLGRAKEPVPHPWSYVRKAIRGEKNPYRRWLSKRPPSSPAVLAGFRPATGPHEFDRHPETGGCTSCKEPREDKIHKPRRRATA